MPTARWAFASAVVNGKIYAIGGGSGTTVWVTAVEEYDPATDTWTTKTPMPEPLGSIGDAAVVGGKIYLMPLYQLSGYSSSLFIYDPASDNWATGSNYIPVPTVSCGIGSVRETIYMVGGTGLGKAADCTTSMVQAYTPSSATWEWRSPMPTRSAGVRMAALNGILFAAGGRHYDPTCFSPVTSQDVAAYDPVTDSWTTKPDLPCGQEGAGTCSANGRVYVIGGVCNWGTCPVTGLLSVVHEFDPAANAWTTKTPIPGPLVGGGAVAVGCTIYVFGGKMGTGWNSDSTSVYAGCLANCPPYSPPPAPAPLTFEVYPNPFVPEQAIRGTLKFQGVPAGASVRVYTSSGLKAWEATGNGRILEWDGKNQAGRRVAPGVYQWVIESAGVRRRGKVVVER